MNWITKGLATAALLGGTVLAQAVSVDKELPKYTKTTGVSGNIKSVGSDTMNNLMTLWAEELQASIYPNVNARDRGQGLLARRRPRSSKARRRSAR